LLLERTGGASSLLCIARGEALDWMQQRGNTSRETLFPFLFPLFSDEGDQA
jgi:hypothetical protein